MRVKHIDNTSNYSLQSNITGQSNYSTNGTAYGREHTYISTHGRRYRWYSKPSIHGQLGVKMESKNCERTTLSVWTIKDEDTWNSNTKAVVTITYLFTYFTLTYSTSLVSYRIAIVRDWYEYATNPLRGPYEPTTIKELKQASTGTTNCLRHSVPTREELVIVCVGMRGDAGQVK